MTNTLPASDTLLRFPTAFPIKVMGRTSATDDAFKQLVLAVVARHAPDFAASSIEVRPSKNGNFVSITATINATSKAQIDTIYLELTANPLVLMAL